MRQINLMPLSHLILDAKQLATVDLDPGKQPDCFWAMAKFRPFETQNSSIR
jgi:hypothetical protein